MADYFSLRDLSRAPELAMALGNMVIAWASAETILLGTLARVTDCNLNLIQAGYYRIPTFEARVKFIRGLITEWHGKGFDKASIDTAIEKLAKLARTRNHWVHGDWCASRDSKDIVVFDLRSDVDSPQRRKPVKAADVENHVRTVLSRSDELAALIKFDKIDA